MKAHNEKLQRTTDDIIIMLTDEEELFRKKFVTEKVSDEWNCTVCAKVSKDKTYPHPALRVSICFDCLKSYQNAVFLVNKDGTDKNCRWCAHSAKKYTCTVCTVVFCKNCIERNFDKEFVQTRVANNLDWNCFICDPKPLWRLRSECSKVMDLLCIKTNLGTEVIDLISQESYEDKVSITKESIDCSPESQIIPLKKSLIFDISDANSVSKTQTVNVESSEDDNLSEANISSLSTTWQDTGNELKTFISVFNYRTNQLSQKFQCENIRTIDETEKLNKKVSEFCDKAIENLLCIKENNKKRYEDWQQDVKNKKLQRKLKPKNKTISNSKIHDNEHNKPSTSQCKIKNSKSSNKRKFNLSLKTSKHVENSSNSEDTLEFLEKIEQTLPDDTISPNKQVSRETESQKVSENVKLESNIPQKQIKEQVQKSLVNKQNQSKCNDDKSSLSSERKIKEVQSKTNVDNNSLNIKSELESADNVSNFSHETVIRDKLNNKVQVSTDLVKDRILQDFGKTVDNKSKEVTVKIDHYLCETTGEIYQSYTTDLNDTISEQSEDTENYDWNDMVELANNKTDDNIENISNNQRKDSSSSEEKSNKKIKCDTNNCSQISVSDTNLSEDESVDVLSITDSDLARQEALESLMSDSSKSISEESIHSDDFFHASEQRINLNETGYVRELNIADEVAKLRETFREESNVVESSDCDSSVSDSETENEESTKLADPKLSMRAVVLLPSDVKLLMKPVVVIEKIDFDNCFGLVKHGNSYSISTTNSDDSSDSEIERLTNLKTLNKQRILSTSESDSDSSSKICKHNKRRIKKISGSGYESDISISSLKSETYSLLSLNLASKDNDYFPEINENILNDTEQIISDDESETLEPKKSKKQKTLEENIISDDSNDSNKRKNNWRKDKLLTKNLNLVDSDTDDTNDSRANEILKKEEEKYLKKINKENTKKKRSDKCLSDTDDDEDDAIILSTDDSCDSNNSDIQFVGLKRKHDFDEEEIVKNKKGRRNIRGVLKDSELHEETKKAEKEDSERKERLSLKQKNLETVLSESQLDPEEVGFVLDVDEEKKKPLVSVHHTLVPPLKDHQKKGIKFMWDVCYESVAQLKTSSGAGCILAHCMGLGKTMQVVVLVHTLLCHKETNVNHVLIVCPLSTVYNWKNEFDQTLKPCPKKIRLFDIRPGKQKCFNDKMFEVRRWKAEGGVLIIGYESFQTLVNDAKLSKYEETYRKDMIESLIDPGPQLVVCDEGHMLKNGKTIRFTSLSRIKTKRRIILTGTPLQNNLIEYYYMVNFVKPHLLGTLEEYKNRFVNPISNGQYGDSNKDDIHLMKKRSHILHKKLENTIQRFEVSELIPYLPEKHDYVLYVQLTPLQIKLYEHYLSLLDINTKKLFKNYHALQNIWTHPALLKIKFDKRKENVPKNQKRYDEYFEPLIDPDSEQLDIEWFRNLLPEDVLSNISYGLKIQILFSIIKECDAIHEKLLVFSSSIDELDLIEYFLKQQTDVSWIKEKDYYRMDGTVIPERRIKYCNEFNDVNNHKSRLFLVSHKVGGLGLNLTAASRVVLMDVSWNPSYDIQSVFRVYRFGQKKTCYIYRLVSMGTMEEVVYSRAVTKLAVAGRVVDEHQIKRHFNSDDLQRMYRLEKNFSPPPIPTVPTDRLLAKLWETHNPLLYKFCDHQSMLENLVHEELNEEDMKLAWEEFRNEVEREKQAKEMVSSYVMKFLDCQQANIRHNMMLNAVPNMLPAYSRGWSIDPSVIQQKTPVRYKRPITLLNAIDQPACRPLTSYTIVPNDNTTSSISHYSIAPIVYKASTSYDARRISISSNGNTQLTNRSLNITNNVKPTILCNSGNYINNQPSDLCPSADVPKPQDNSVTNVSSQAQSGQKENINMQTAIEHLNDNMSMIPNVQDVHPNSVPIIIEP